MRTKTLAYSVPILCLISCGVFRDSKPGTRSSEIDQAEAAHATEEASRIGPEHEYLATLVGTWKVKFKHRSGPHSAWQEEEGSASFRMALSGRYLVEEIQGAYSGTPYEGYRVHGYDNLSGYYFNIWMDNLGTWPVTSHGTKDDEGVLRYIGRWKDIETPAGRPFRTVVRNVNENEWQLAFYDTIDGEEVRILEATYTRSN